MPRIVVLALVLIGSACSPSPTQKDAAVTTSSTGAAWTEPLGAAAKDLAWSDASEEFLVATSTSATQITPITVEKAVWGYFQTNKTCDATGKIAAACNGKAACRFEANNTYCGDPLPGIMKEMRVTYSCKGVKKDATEREWAVLELSCSDATIKRTASQEARVKPSSAYRDCSGLAGATTIGDGGVELTAVVPSGANIIKVTGYARNENQDWKPCRADGGCFVDYSAFCVRPQSGQPRSSDGKIEVKWRFANWSVEGVNGGSNITKDAQIIVHYTGGRP